MVITKARQFFNYLIFILIGFGISSLIFSFIINPEIIEVGKEQPMLLLLHDSWGENIDDSEELIFRHYIYNFGDIEAKNIIITCQLSLGLGEGDIVWEEHYSIGNLASNSYKYYESYMKYYSNSDDYYGTCKIISTDGNYINLYDKIPDLK